MDMERIIERLDGGKKKKEIMTEGENNHMT